MLHVTYAKINVLLCNVIILFTLRTDAWHMYVQHLQFTFGINDVHSIKCACICLFIHRLTGESKATEIYVEKNDHMTDLIPQQTVEKKEMQFVSERL